MPAASQASRLRGPPRQVSTQVFGRRAVLFLHGVVLAEELTSHSMVLARGAIWLWLGPSVNNWPFPVLARVG